MGCMSNDEGRGAIPSLSRDITTVIHRWDESGNTKKVGDRAQLLGLYM